MVTRVEELRKKVLSVCFDTSAIDDIAALITAAKTEGSAETIEKIRKWVYEPDPANRGNYIHLNVLGGLEFIMLPDLLFILDPKDSK